MAYAVGLGNYKRIRAAITSFVFRCIKSSRLELTRNRNNLCFTELAAAEERCCDRILDACSRVWGSFEFNLVHAEPITFHVQCLQV